nr:nucleoside triphosphate pyrophosphohydrolase family protein [Lacticaseibacillus absianus]
MNDYQQQANKTLAGNEHVLTNLTLGLASDGGKVVDLVKKYTFQGYDLDRAELKRDLGDVLWYLSQIALWADIPFDEVAQANLTKLKKKYPNIKL